MARKNIGIIGVFNQLAKTTKLIIMGAIAAVLLIVIILTVIFAPEGNISFNSRISLKEILESSDLTTSEYTYNSYVAVRNGDSDEIKYYVAYEGTVRAGFDFDKIDIVQDGNKVTITIPVITIQSVVIDTGSMDYIFLKNKYDTETTFQEAYNACEADLKSKADENETFRRTAYEGAKETIRALTRVFDSQYEIIIQFADTMMGGTAQ